MRFKSVLVTGVAGLLGGYVTSELARAYQLALQLMFSHYVICGRNTLAPEPTVGRSTALTGRHPVLKQPHVVSSNPFAPLYDHSAAEKHLGFVAEHDMRSLLYPTVKS